MPKVQSDRLVFAVPPAVSGKLRRYLAAVGMKANAWLAGVIEELPEYELRLVGSTVPPERREPVVVGTPTVVRTANEALGAVLGKYAPVVVKTGEIFVAACIDNQEYGGEVEVAEQMFIRAAQKTKLPDVARPEVVAWLRENAPGRIPVEWK